MSLTAILWLLMFGALTLMSFRSAAYGAALYLLTYFALPAFWWWGQSNFLGQARWSLASSIVFLISTLIHNLQAPEPDPPDLKRMRWVLFAILVNDSLVHLLLAAKPDVSLEAYTLVLKYTALFLVMTVAIRTRQDMMVMAAAIMLGIGYMGYEATINDRGSIHKGRVEGLGTAAAAESNSLSSLLATPLPFLGGMFFLGTPGLRALAICTVPFAINLILMCKSRAAMLALSLSAMGLVFFARGKARWRAILAVGLASLGTMFLMRDESILARYMTTFAKEEERDEAAAYRLVCWNAGLEMVRDYPMGSGGYSFKKVRGTIYLARAGYYEDVRAVHNGYINEACEWGVQGLALRLVFLFLGILAAYRAMMHCIRAQDNQMAFLGACLMSSIFTFLISSFFSDVLDSEWGYWMVALAGSYARLCYYSVHEYHGFVPALAYVDGRPTWIAPVGYPWPT